MTKKQQKKKAKASASRHAASTVRLQAAAALGDAEAIRSGVSNANLPQWPRDRYIQALKPLSRRELVAFGYGCVRHALPVWKGDDTPHQALAAIESWAAGKMSDAEIAELARTLLGKVWPAAHRALYAAGEPENRVFDPATGQLRVVERDPSTYQAVLHNHTLENTVDAALAARNDVRLLANDSAAKTALAEQEAKWQDELAGRILTGALKPEDAIVGERPQRERAGKKKAGSRGAKGKAPARKRS